MTEISRIGSWVSPDNEMVWTTFEDGAPGSDLLDELYAFDASKQATSFIKPGILPEQVPALSPAESPEELLHTLAGEGASTCIRRDHQGAIAGYITIAPTTEYDRRTFSSRVARVLSIAALHGHGSPLMTCALEKLQTEEFTDVVLDVHPFNSAVAFYGKHGFGRYSHGLQWLQLEGNTELQDMLDVHSNDGGPLTSENTRVTLFRYLGSSQAWEERRQAMSKVGEMNRKIGNLGLVYTLQDNEKIVLATQPESLAEARHSIDVLLRVYMNRHPDALREGQFSAQTTRHIIEFVLGAGVKGIPETYRYLCKCLGVSMDVLDEYFWRQVNDEIMATIPPASQVSQQGLLGTDVEFDETGWRQMVVHNYAYLP